VFSRTDLVTDSEYFYNLIIDVLEDPEEHVETTELVKWWNQYVVLEPPIASVLRPSFIFQTDLPNLLERRSRREW
jgi:hypothetical protein